MGGVMNRENREENLNPSSPQSSPPMEERRKLLSPLGSTRRVTSWDEGIN